MPDTLISQFERVFNNPIETNRQVATIFARNAIPADVRWEGMLVHVKGAETYKLGPGLGNGDWEVLGGLGDAPTDGLTYARNNGSWTPIGGGGASTVASGIIHASSPNITNTIVDSRETLFSYVLPTTTAVQGTQFSIEANLKYEAGAGTKEFIIFGKNTFSDTILTPLNTAITWPDYDTIAPAVNVKLRAKVTRDESGNWMVSNSASYSNSDTGSFYVEGSTSSITVGTNWDTSNASFEVRTRVPTGGQVRLDHVVIEYKSLIIL